MKKYFKLLIALFVLSLAFAIFASATDFSGYTPISDADGLLALMNSSSALTGKYYLTNDIDLTGKTQSPIGKANGKSFGTASAPAIFDGNGYTVKGVNISGGAYTGFFGVVANAEIRNLTISGTISSTADNTGGLVAYAKTSIVIENCTNNCDVTSTGINVGGILGSTEANTVTSLTISSCTNNASVKAYRVIGGIVGLLQRKSNATYLIEKCINNGDITSTRTSDTTKMGGILGASNSGSPKSFIITKCLNTGKIDGYFYLGGIAGELGSGTDTEATAYEKAVFQVTECMNAGEVVSSGATAGKESRVGGILGNFSKIGNISDCLNIGTISAKLHHVGGILGHTDKDSYFVGAKNNLNRAEILLNGVAITNNDYVNSIGGFLPYKPYGVNYYTGTLQGKEWSHSNGSKSTQYKTELFDNLNESGNWTNPEEPVLIEFQYLTCKHENVVFAQNGNNITFTCDKCDTLLYTDTSVLCEVYVDYENGALASKGKDLGTESAPFKSIEEAFEYVAIAANIKNSDAKITIKGKAVLGDTFKTPVTEKTITVRGGNFHFGGAKIANRHLNLGGPLVFENITFTSTAAESRINAQNNKLVMGEGIVMANATSTSMPTSGAFSVNDVKMFITGGFYENIPAKMATDVTIRSGEYYIVSGFNATNSTQATEGVAKLTVGKTNESDTLKICDLVAFSTVAQTRLTADSTATIIIDGTADIGRIMMSEREKTTNDVRANYITNLVLRGTISESYRTSYNKPYGFDITGGSHTEDSLGYHTFRIFTDARVAGAVYAEYAFFGGDGYTADSTLVSGGYKPVSKGGDTTLTRHTYMEYCLKYLGGHADNDGDTLCDECGAKVNCAHENAQYIVLKENNCTEKGFKIFYCGECDSTLSEIETDIIEDAHVYVWESTSNGYQYVCTHNAAHVYRTHDEKTNKFYVSNNGKPDGGFSKSYPSNDFDAMMRLAATLSEDATIYVVGTITIQNNSTTNYEVYFEPNHSNTVTVQGVGDTSGVIKIGTRNTRMEYVLSGNTTFTQIEFDSGISTDYFVISARHHRLVMGKNISTSFGRNESTAANGGKLSIIGGCDNMVDKTSCSKKTTDITLQSGTYYMVVGGSSSKACGLKNGTINIKVLGDITVGGVVTSQNGYTDRQFILGSHSANAGDINFTLNGVLTCTNAFCVGSYGV